MQIMADYFTLLIISTKNGGKIYDLAIAQKIREMETRKRETQDQLVKEMKNLSTSGYANSWNSNLTVFSMGKKTELYNDLTSVAGIRH
jgi:hypothetical protein